MTGRVSRTSITLTGDVGGNSGVTVETGGSRRYVYAIGRNDGFRFTPSEAWELAQALQKHAYECGFIPEVEKEEVKTNES